MGGLRQLLLGVSWGLWLSLAQAAPLQLLTEDAPPMSFEREGRPEGLAVEVVRELARRLDEPIELQLVPWTRAYHLAQKQPDTAVFSTVRTAEREHLFQWVGPLLQGHTRFYSLRSRQLRIETLEEAARVQAIAVPRLWYSYETLKGLGLGNVLGVTGSRQMVRLLKLGRAQLIATEDLTLAQELAAGGLSLDQVQPQMVIMRSDYYIAFSPRTDSARVRRWQAMLDHLRAEGWLDQRIERWLPGLPKH